MIRQPPRRIRGQAAAVPTRLNSCVDNVPSFRSSRGKQVSLITIDTAVAQSTAGCMARALRIQYPGAIYHAMNRGDQREDIVRDDEDRERFLATLTEVCSKTGWQVHACRGSRPFFFVIFALLCG